MQDITPTTPVSVYVRTGDTIAPLTLQVGPDARTITADSGLTFTLPDHLEQPESPLQAAMWLMETLPMPVEYLSVTMVIDAIQERVSIPEHCVTERDNFIDSRGFGERFQMETARLYISGGMDSDLHRLAHDVAVCVMHAAGFPMGSDEYELIGELFPRRSA